MYRKLLPLTNQSVVLYLLLIVLYIIPVHILSTAVTTLSQYIMDL